MSQHRAYHEANASEDLTLGDYLAEDIGSSVRRAGEWPEVIGQAAQSVKKGQKVLYLCPDCIVDTEEGEPRC